MRYIHPSAYEFGGKLGTVWEQLHTTALDLGRLEGSEKCDVLVVGAGLTGLSAAYHLVTEHGANVVVIDAAEPGWGSTGRSLGIAGTSPLWLYNKVAQRNRNGQGTAKLLKTDELAIGMLRGMIEAHGWSVDLTEGAHVTMARTQTEFRDLATQFEAFFEDPLTRPYPMTPADLRDEVAVVPSAAAGFRDPRGFALSPLLLVQEMVRTITARGGRIYSGTRTRKLENLSRSVRLHHPGGTISASHAIMATNAQSRGQTIDGMSGAYLPVQFAAMATRPLTEFELRSSNIEAPFVLRFEDELLGPAIIRLLPNRQLLMSAVVSLETDPGQIGQLRTRLHTRLAGLLPSLRSAQIAHLWRGLGARTHSGLPFVGPLRDDMPDVTYAGGLDFDSASLSVWLGSLAASSALYPSRVESMLFGSTTPIDQYRLSGWTFTRLRGQVEKKVASL